MINPRLFRQHSEKSGFKKGLTRILDKKNKMREKINFILVMHQHKSHDINPHTPDRITYLLGYTVNK